MTGNEPDTGLRIARTVPENADVTSVYIKGPDLEKFKKRKPGQFATIRIMGEDGWSEAHPFTISCSPEEDHLKLTIKKSGAFTSKIRNVKPGTPVRCAGPYGAFCKDIETRSEIVMIAGGVGITPFLSVLRHFAVEKAANRITLFWANKTLDDAFAREELANMAESLNLTVVHVLSRQPDPEALKALDTDKVRHMPGHLNRTILGPYAASSGASFYLCGPPPMQDAVLKELASCGVDPDTVQKEAFAYSRPKQNAPDR